MILRSILSQHKESIHGPSIHCRVWLDSIHANHSLVNRGAVHDCRVFLHGEESLVEFLGGGRIDGMVLCLVFIFSDYLPVTVDNGDKWCVVIVEKVLVVSQRLFVIVELLDFSQKFAHVNVVCVFHCEMGF